MAIESILIEYFIFLYPRFSLKQRELIRNEEIVCLGVEYKVGDCNLFSPAILSFVHIDFTILAIYIYYMMEGASRI